MTSDEIKRERERIDRERNELEIRMDALDEESQRLQSECTHPNTREYVRMGTKDGAYCEDCGCFI